MACYPYTTALAVIHLSLAGARGEAAQLDRARDLWEGMQRIRRTDGSWHDAYDVRTGEPLPDAMDRATGPNSWMVLAGLHLYRARGDHAILEDARETMDWVLSCQIVDGDNPHRHAVTLHPAPAEEIISTEANVDALAAAWGMAQAPNGARRREYREAAENIVGWLTETMWLDENTPKCFATGTENGQPKLQNEWLDSQTWTILALAATGGVQGVAPAQRDGLPVLDDRVTEVPFAGRTLRGFSKMTRGPSAFWPEGVAGYVLAARRVDKFAAAATFWSDLKAIRGADGTLPHIIGTVRGEDWSYDHRVKAVDGTVWTAWAAVNFNPFLTDATAPTAQ